MRIAMVVPTLGFAGGIEAHARDLAASLGRRGHQVLLLHGAGVGRDRDSYVRPFARVAPLEDAASLRSAIDVAYVHKASDVRELNALDGVPLAVATHDHDLTCIRSHRYLPMNGEPCHRPPGTACIAYGCCVVRDRRPRTRFPLRLANPFALRERLVRLAERGPLVANGRYVADQLLAAGVSRERVHIIHPIPVEPLQPPRPRPTAARVLVAGQLLRGKGVDIAIEALARLPHEVELHVVGDGSARRALESWARRHAPGRVTMHGYMPPERMTEHYDAANVVAVPSRWPEPFGMVGLEAMRRARPVAGAAHGGIVEWLRDGEGGRLFAPGSAAGLARAIGELLDDRDAGERAREAVRARFSHARSVEAVEALLAGLAG